jgi:hypothetical protein
MYHPPTSISGQQPLVPAFFEKQSEELKVLDKNIQECVQLYFSNQIAYFLDLLLLKITCYQLQQSKQNEKISEQLQLHYDHLIEKKLRDDGFREKLLPCYYLMGKMLIASSKEKGGEKIIFSRAAELRVISSLFLDFEFIKPYELMKPQFEELRLEFTSPHFTKKIDAMLQTDEFKGQELLYENLNKGSENIDKTARALKQLEEVAIDVFMTKYELDKKFTAEEAKELWKRFVEAVYIENGLPLPEEHSDQCMQPVPVTSDQNYNNLNDLFNFFVTKGHEAEGLNKLFTFFSPKKLFSHISLFMQHEPYCHYSYKSSTNLRSFYEGEQKEHARAKNPLPVNAAVFYLRFSKTFSNALVVEAYGEEAGQNFSGQGLIYVDHSNSLYPYKTDERIGFSTLQEAIEATLKGRKIVSPDPKVKKEGRVALYCPDPFFF